jgi:hypothetical protein
MTKDEALDKALNALLWANIEINDWRDDAHGYTPEDQPQIMEAITAIKQALAAPDLKAELEATNRQVEILSDALAESRREVDAMVALARADEREVVEDLFQEYDMVDSAFARDFRARSCPPCNEDCDQGRNCPARKSA